MTRSGATQYQEARRELASVLAPAERRVLRWLAERMPRWVSSDQLTLLVSSLRTTRTLYEMERLPPQRRPSR